MSDKNVDDLAKKLSESLPEGFTEAKEELEGNFRSVIQGSLNKMNFVSREDFDIQVRVLEKAKQQLAELEQRVATLTGGTPSKPTEND